ncbi:hypothetical protein SKAU_G00143680 [Synaphobranchus kaupii]|uniref:ubiquitinyl hydrolase 1 n=1 Tax=Synaphobranchus kaupii TaxID=118154 RepID=A0A9Q1J2E3_SYNKA|nr:hypothetical protein SKAU_G00143680 [Synaphobranchus kaupii]
MSNWTRCQFDKWAILCHLFKPSCWGHQEIAPLVAESAGRPLHILHFKTHVTHVKHRKSLSPALSPPSDRWTMTELGVKWACEYCTYENWPSAIKCTMCRAQRPSGTIITEEPFKSGPGLDSGREWDPPGTEGGSALLICPDSSARPRVKPAGTAETSSKWSCHLCTYLNWPRAIRCTQCLCQRQRARSPTDSPQTSGSGSRPTAPPQDPCEEYNDRNRLNTRAQHWTCTACTYENWPKTRKCVVCDHPKPSGPEAIELAEPGDTSAIINEQDRARWRGSGCSGGQRRSPPDPQEGVGGQDGLPEDRAGGRRGREQGGAGGGLQKN